MGLSSSIRPALTSDTYAFRISLPSAQAFRACSFRCFPVGILISAANQPSPFLQV